MMIHVRQPENCSVWYTAIGDHSIFEFYRQCWKIGYISVASLSSSIIPTVFVPDCYWRRKMAPLCQHQEWLSQQKGIKVSTHSSKLILCIWCDKECIVYYESLQRNIAITAGVYCQQLCRTKTARKNTVNTSSSDLQHNRLFGSSVGRLPYIHPILLTLLQQVSISFALHRITFQESPLITISSANIS